MSSLPKHIVHTSFLVFSLLGILFIPFPFHLFSYQESISLFLFGDLISFIKPHIFSNTTYTEISSDSSSLYTLIFILVTLSILVSFIIALQKCKQFWNKVSPVILPVICFYLSMQLLKYGYGKITFRQFYTPDPNTLFTPLGFLEKDILFWSTVGTSTLFNLFLGASEIIAGILLLFRKTRFIGLLFSCLIFMSVVAINFGFDISVKVYATFLLTISLVGLSLYSKLLGQIWIVIKRTPSQKMCPDKTRFAYSFVKFFVVLLIFIEIFLPDIEAKTLLNSSSKLIPDGAYNVVESSMSSDIKKVFFHRSNYIIFQNQEDQMADYSYQVKGNLSEIVLTDYDLKKKYLQFNFDEKDSSIYLKNLNDETYLIAKMIDLNSLPIFSSQFHWVID